VFHVIGAALKLFFTGSQKNHSPFTEKIGVFRHCWPYKFAAISFYIFLNDGHGAGKIISEKRLYITDYLSIK